ncbi:hypothetical protein PFDG_04777 [Plasmodium falciparum Dd2]|uniref:Uncharacterized protein n=1 Tax=Plasmodium falciparum (isolate Dd2) TaxID=57267 RepID=A0A0L7M8U5_PLAF4|nr:hypothetical protein PFDG_04777 [Plasmodium falciparum Dd2]
MNNTNINNNIEEKILRLNIQDVRQNNKLHTCRSLSIGSLTELKAYKSLSYHDEVKDEKTTDINEINPYK